MHVQLKGLPINFNMLPNMCKTSTYLPIPTSGLPYDVTPEQALEHEEVRERINQSVVALQQATDKFLTAILKSPDKIP